MTSQQISRSDLLDISFENRNKSYGAYELRRAYHQQLARALTVAVGSSFLLLFFLGPSSTNTASAGEGEKKVVVVETFVPPTEQKPEPPPPAPSSKVRQQAYVDNIQITPNDIVAPLPPQDALAEAVISDKTVESNMVSETLAPPVTPAKEPANTAPSAPEEKKEVVPDKQPQFPGGVQAWLSFLSRNLQAPEAMEGGEKKTVIIRFQVAEDGSVTNYQVVQSAGSAFDNEVIRVLKKMPKWAPASKGGQPVSVSFTQPVTFVGMDE